MNEGSKPRLRLILEIIIVLAVAGVAYLYLTGNIRLLPGNEELRREKEVFISGWIEDVSEGSLILAINRNNETVNITVMVDTNTLIVKLDTLNPDRKIAIPFSDLITGDTVTVTTESAVGTNTTIYATEIIKL